MKAYRFKLIQCLLMSVLLLGYSVSASAISLLLPAVQKASGPVSLTEPLTVTIDGLGSFDAGPNGNLPILAIDLMGATFDTSRAGDSGVFQTEILSMDLRGNVAGGPGSTDPLDVFINLYPPDPIVPNFLTFTTTAASSDGSSAQGELKGNFHFIVEVALIDRNDPDKITAFMHEDMLSLFGLWHSEGEKLVIDSPFQLDGMIQGKLAIVPLPASWLLFLCGLAGLSWLKREGRGDRG